MVVVVTMMAKKPKNPRSIIIPEYGIRGFTLDAIKYVVHELERCYTHPISPDDPLPISLEEAVNHVYDEFVLTIHRVPGFNSVSRFDGRVKIINAIRAEILKNQHILLTDRPDDVQIGNHFVQTEEIQNEW